MRQWPQIAIGIAKVAAENGWTRTSFPSGERYIRGDRAVRVIYAANGKVWSAMGYYGPRGTRIKGGRRAIEAELERFGAR